MPIDKACISRPLEAGQSLLDTQLFSPQVLCALEYVSSRLARKHLNISLVVSCFDEHNPITPCTQSFASPLSSASESPASPYTFKRAQSACSLHSVSSSTSRSTTSTSSTTSSLRIYPSSPASYKARSPQSPTHNRRPGTPKSPNPYGITLIYASTLTVKSSKILQQYITKAEKKFSMGSGWLSSPPSSEVSANELIRRSLMQNEVLFSSEGLTLLATDHGYVFKCQLQTYSRTLSSCDLTSTVDELRRLVLAQHGRQISRAYFIEAYKWLDIDLDALAQVEERYRIAYGDLRGVELQSEDMRPIRLGTNAVLPRTQHPTRTQQLRLQTNFERDSPIEDRGPHFRGPATPNRGDDITPITQGEWSFLMINRDRPAARIMTIETY